ncbi:MAG: FkbM family methyltransferase [Planctomycetota bacterium]|jgi:FkbM family methyltransferase
MKILVNLLCCLVPQKKWRKEIKRILSGTKSRRQKLLAHGCKIENEIVTTPEGIKIDISNVPHEAMGITKEVFLEKDYALKFDKKSVLIDIGLNRGIASLFFAKYANIKNIYAFEPFTPTFELAKNNLDLNPELSKKIKPFNFGLGKSEKILELPYIGKATGSMSTTHDVCKDEKNIKTETVVIKDAAKEVSSILNENKTQYVIVKCDCEGAEFEIFERLDEANLIRGIDIVLIEYHFHVPGRLVSILTKNGFAVRTETLSKKMNTGYIYAVRTAEK